MNYTLEDLLYLMQRLREPETGCPWDIKQTFTSINGSTIEEAYELVDAIQHSAQNNYLDEHVKEELGDVLFQVVFYSQLADENGDFNFQQVVDVLTQKLIRRHPHVFPDGDLNARRQGQIDEAEVKRQWEAIKAEERGEKTQTGLFDDVPLSLPSLKRAQKIQKRASNVGFDWPDAQSAAQKLHEEVAEVQTALDQGDAEQVADELADLMFACVNVARHLGQDAESLAERANKKFLNRFVYIEESLAKQGLDCETASLAQMDDLWEAAKQKKLE